MYTYIYIYTFTIIYNPAVATLYYAQGCGWVGGQQRVTVKPKSHKEKHK